MANNIKATSELMDNYLHAEVMGKSSKFEALQTRDGYSLLFFMNDNNELEVVEEVQNKLTAKEIQDQFLKGTIDHHYKTGWKKVNISGSLNKTCTTFDVNQNLHDKTINLALAIKDNGADKLYLCLGKSDQNMSWLSSPQWVDFPYKSASGSGDNAVGSSMKIVNVFVSETHHSQYIIVDTESGNNTVKRYYVNTRTKTWEPHPLTIDLSTQGYHNCMGRITQGGNVDGVYTAGHISGSSQFVYVPVTNFSGNDAPKPIDLSLPNNTIVEALASVRNHDFSTDLFCAAKGNLYYYAQGKQDGHHDATLLLSHPLFTGVTKIYAHKSSSQVVVWGLNQSNQVFYTSCATGQEATASSWKLPMVIAKGITALSPYLNRIDDGNTFFAVAGTELYKLIKSPNTNLWKKQHITLPVSDVMADPLPIKSYTTHVQYTDENNIPIANKALNISTNTRTHLYINNLYYLVDSDEIQVNTDSEGGITIIEPVHSLHSIQIKVSDGAENLSINPMDTVMGTQSKPGKLGNLNSTQKLSSAQIVTHTINGKSSNSLIQGNPSSLSGVATTNQNLNTTYHNVRGHVQTQNAISLGRERLQNGGVMVDIGDLFNWIETEAENAVHAVVEAAGDVYHFVATIAGQAYHAVLNCAEHVVGAFEWVFKQIGVGLEKLFKYAKFLFEWEDISNTKKVIKNVVIVYLKDIIGNLSTIKTATDTSIENLIRDIQTWANDNSWKSSHLNKKSTETGSTPGKGQHASGNMMMHHFKHNAHQQNLHYTVGAPNTSLWSHIKNDVWSHVKGDFTAIQGQVESLIKNWHSKSFDDIIIDIIAILGESVLTGAKAIITASFDLLEFLAEKIIEFLDAPLDVPVISYILKKLGVPSPSILDILSWVLAVPGTILIKLVTDKPPFPANVTSALINAQNMTDIHNVATLPVSNHLEQNMQIDAATGNGPSTGQKIVYVGFKSLAGMSVMSSALIKSYDAADPSGTNPYRTPGSVFSCVGAVLSALGEYFCAERALIDSKSVDLKHQMTGVKIFSKIAFCGTVASWGDMGRDESRLVGAFASSLCDAILLFPTIQHFKELNSAPADMETAIAYTEEIGRCVLATSTFSYNIAVVTAGTPVQDYAAIAFGITKFIGGGIYLLEADFAGHE